MTQQQRPQQVCIGLSIEGAVLRLAVVGRFGQKLNIMDLASMPLPVKQFASSVEDESSKSENPFDESPGSDSGETEDNIDFSSIREFLATHYQPRASFALGLEEPHVHTMLLPMDKKDTPAKIRTRVVEEIQKTLNVQLPKRAIALTRAGSSNALAIASIEASPMVDICTAPQGGDKRATRINFITSNDIALINMVRVHYPAKSNELMHIIHVDEDVTHFYVMRGRDIEYMAPPIQQGAHDAHLVSTLYNRIELTAENAGYMNPDRVALSGKAEEIGLKEEILENNPNVVFHSLRRLRIGHSDDKAILQEMNSYIVPISLAWEALQPKNPHFYRLDVTPQRVLQEQKIFKLAWHGVLLLLALFFVVTMITVMVLERQEEISTIETALRFDKQALSEQQQIVDQINELEARSQAIRIATITLDTLLVNAEVWSETLDTLAHATAHLGNLWVSEMKFEKDGGTAVIGYSTQRSSVPSMATMIGNTKMREITVQDIGQAKVFRYDIQLKIDSLPPYSGSRAAVWHDSVRTAIGEIGLPASPSTDATEGTSPPPRRRR
jgi:Tfp pilus assembly protein PilN